MHTPILTSPHPVLGSQVVSYTPRKRRWREAWLWPIPGFLISIILLITGLDWYYYGYTQYGPVAATAWSQNWLTWGVLIGILTLVTTIWQVYHSRVQVTIFRYGIEVKTPGHSRQPYRWEDITGIASTSTQEQFFGHTYHVNHRLTIWLIKGNPISLDDHIANLLELATRLKANLYPRLLPGLRSRFQSGQPIPFGPITIQSGYIIVREDQIPWNQIKHITVMSGHLIVDGQAQTSKQSNRYHLSVSKIPNIELLLQLMQRE